MPRPAPPHLLLAAPPGAPGAEAVLRAFAERAARRSGATVLLTEKGLAWTGRSELRQLSERHGVDVAVCSRSARDAGWRVQPREGAPAYVRWSSLATWLAERPAASDLWTVLP